MADVALLATSAALTIYLPRRHANHLKTSSSLKTMSSISVALGLSLILFSLSILEILPSTWRILLLDDKQGGDEATVLLRGSSSSRFMTITTVYRLILWGLCVMVIGVLPAVVGSRLMEEISTTTTVSRRADPDAEPKQYPRCGAVAWARNNNNSSWSSSFRMLLWILFSILMKIINVVICKPCRLLWRNVKRKTTEPILVMTVKQDEAITRRSTTTIKTIQSAFQCLIKMMETLFYRKSYLLGGMGGIVTCVVLLATLGPRVIDSPAAAKDGNNNAHPQLLLATLVSWLCAVGLLLSSVLNGFGSVSMPHSYLVGLFIEPIRPDVLAKAEEDLANTVALLDAKQSELANNMSSTPLSSSSATSTGAAAATADVNGSRRRSVVVAPTTTHRKSFADFGEEFAKRRRRLYKELDFLELLCEELQEDVTEMKRAQALATNARTPGGRIRSYLGILFSIVLLIRLFAAAVSMLQSYYPPVPTTPPSQDDPITTSLLWLMGHDLVSQEDYAVLSQCISLVLTAILSVSQVQTFLRLVASINRRINHFFTKFNCKRTTRSSREAAVSALSLVDDNDNNNHNNHNKGLPFGARPGVYTHLLAFVMGCYFLSCVVLIKLSLPVAYRFNFAAALGGVEYRIHSSVINATFALSAIVSASALGVLFGIQRQSSQSLSTTWMNDNNNSAAALGNSSLDSSC